jgi:hypothetical protein
MGLAMNTDTIRLDYPDPADLDGLAASLDHLKLWCQSDNSAGQLLSVRRAPI